MTNHYMCKILISFYFHFIRINLWRWLVLLSYKRQPYVIFINDSLGIVPNGRFFSRVIAFPRVPSRSPDPIDQSPRHAYTPESLVCEGSQSRSRMTRLEGDAMRCDATQRDAARRDAHERDKSISGATSTDPFSAHCRVAIR